MANTDGCLTVALCVYSVRTEVWSHSRNMLYRRDTEDNGRKYHTGELGVITITGFVFHGPKNWLLCTSTAIKIEPLS